MTRMGLLIDAADLFDPDPWGRIADENAHRLQRSGFRGWIVEAKPAFLLAIPPGGAGINFRTTDNPEVGVRGSTLRRQAVAISTRGSIRRQGGQVSGPRASLAAFSLLAVAELPHYDVRV